MRIFIAFTITFFASHLFGMNGYAQSVSDKRVYSVYEVLEDLNSDGIYDFLGDSVVVSGRVNVASGIFSEQYFSIYIQDEKAGLLVFGGDLSVDVSEGDSVHIVGELDLYFGKPEIIAISVEVIDHPKVEIRPVNITTIFENPDAFLGMLVEGELVVSQKKASTGFGGITVTSQDSSEQVYEIYLSQSHANRDMFDLSIYSIGDKVVARGILSKYRFESTGTEIYQIIPRTPEDISSTGLPQHYFSILLWVIGFVSILVLGWVYFLRKQVKSKTKELSQALEEKEVLMQEIHHRVKNNLAKISGLLDLQISTTDHPAVEESLSDSKSRINSMALIHDKLYQTQQYKTVRLDNYLQELVTTIHTTYNVEEDSVALNFECDPVELSVDKAVVCGLLVNELIVNAYKYAFQDNEVGELKVSLKSENECITLSISDNGPGLPDDFDALLGKGLGTILVKNFAQQLDADMQLDSSDRGTKFSFTFK
jgi:two-component sensor histidine kinase